MTYTAAEYKTVLNEALRMLDEPVLQEKIVSVLNQPLGLDTFAGTYFTSNAR